MIYGSNSHSSNGNFHFASVEVKAKRKQRIERGGGVRRGREGGREGLVVAVRKKEKRAREMEFPSLRVESLTDDSVANGKSALFAHSDSSRRLFMHGDVRMSFGSDINTRVVHPWILISRGWELHYSETLFIVTGKMPSVSNG